MGWFTQFKNVLCYILFYTNLFIPTLMIKLLTISHCTNESQTIPYFNVEHYWLQAQGSDSLFHHGFEKTFNFGVFDLSHQTYACSFLITVQIQAFQLFPVLSFCFCDFLSLHKTYQYKPGWHHVLMVSQFLSYKFHLSAEDVWYWLVCTVTKSPQHGN